jgi:hypothetical protein
LPVSDGRVNNYALLITPVADQSAFPC